MTENYKSTKTQKRDWVIVGLFLAILATNWVWYQHHQAQELSLKSEVEAWLLQQNQINKLYVCINEDIKPCEISL
jgi:hypothetical protein